MEIDEEAILGLISGRPLSLHQIAEELGISANNRKTAIGVLDLIDNLGRGGKIEIAIDRNAPTLYEGALVGPNTFRYYRLGEAEQLEKKNILSKLKLVPVGQNLRELALGENSTRFFKLFGMKKEREY